MLTPTRLAIAALVFLVARTPRADLQAGEILRASPAVDTEQQLPGAPNADAPLEDLLRELQRQEQQYENLKLSIRIRYDKRPGPPGSSYPEPGTDSETRWKIVRQGPRFLQSKRTVTHNVTLKLLTEETAVFDGHTQRQLWQDAQLVVGNGLQNRKERGLIDDRPAALSHLARPHTFLLGECWGAPLSLVLGDVSELRSYFRARGLRSDWSVQTRDLGVAEFAGLQCRHLRFDATFPDEKNYYGWELWLAEARNLIPIHCRTYRHEYSRSLPIAEQTVEDWLELRPGVWQPRVVEAIGRHSHSLQYEKVTRLAWRRESVVMSAMLDPPAASELFANLEFPPGVRVRVQKDGAVAEEVAAETATATE